MEIIIICLIVLVLLLTAILIKYRLDDRIDPTYLEKFKNEVGEISFKWEDEIARRQEEASLRIKEKTEELEREQILAAENVEKKRKEMKGQIKTLQAEHELSLQNLRNQLNEEEQRQIKHHTQVMSEQTVQTENRIKIMKTEYEVKAKQIEEDFNLYSNEMTEKRNALAAEVSVYEAQQKEIIERFKKDEEIRQQQDFYKIKLDDLTLRDIVKLKGIAEQLNKPVVLYKLIYENYYKVKLEEMFKRVLGDNAKKGGIYKITNVKNQKAYIGRTVNFLERWRLHCKRGLRAEEGTSNRLYQFMWEEGLENFTFEVVEICNKEEQSEKEKYWIKFYSTDTYGYNSNKGG